MTIQYNEISVDMQICISLNIFYIFIGCYDDDDEMYADIPNIILQK